MLERVMIAFLLGCGAGAVGMVKLLGLEVTAISRALEPRSALDVRPQAAAAAEVHGGTGPASGSARGGVRKREK